MTKNERLKHLQKRIPYELYFFVDKSQGDG